jgi:hypothetical protein
MPSEPMRPGDEVEVRSAAEILATLDQRGTLAALPFMPEMIPHVGRRFVVGCTADRLCDTITWSGSRSLPDAVQLGNLRCDGSGHDGCQGDCRLLWKRAWLRRVDPGAPAPAPPPGESAARAVLTALVARNTRQPPSLDGTPDETYRCQATELLRASGTASRFPYLHELTSGNVSPGRYVRVVTRAAVWETLRKLGRMPHVALPGSRTSPLRRPPLDLQPGEWVRIRAKEEIAETIDAKGGTRGLWFDREMLQFCGRKFRVKERVTRFIHDANGKMVQLKSAAVKLEGANCSGELSVGRWFCPRALYPYWREDWLERVPAEPTE